MILSDQHNPFVMGCAGDPIVSTPNLDRLAAEGVNFTATHCQAPLCVPSRMSFLTGRQPSEIGVWLNGCVLGSEVPTFAHALGLGGYHTTLAGRMHFIGPDQRHGFSERLVGDVIGAYGRLPDLGDIGIASAGMSHLAPRRSGPGRTAYMAYDEDVTKAACDWLSARSRSGAEQPFFLLVGYVLPHCPYVCPPDLFDKYYDAVGLPAVEDLSDVHPAVAASRQIRGYDKLSQDDVRRARAAYYGLVEYSDALIGRVVDTIDQLGMRDDTVIVYVSDHGEMNGEHGLFAKTSFYQQSVGVPMIWSWPGRFQTGAAVEAVTSLVDVFPTLTELAGAPPPPALSGTSLTGFLSGSNEARAQDWPNTAFAECIMEDQGSPARMIRKGDWKLNYYWPHEDVQLFDLAADPEERNDLGKDPAFVELRESLKRELLAGWHPDRIRDALMNRRQTIGYYYRWGQAAVADDPDYWTAPDDANAFYFDIPNDDES